MPAQPAPWRDVADHQHGVVARHQLMALGLSRSQARQKVVNGRWQLLLPGVYCTFTGPVDAMATIWAAVLYAGPGAAASHGTALWLAGAVDERPVVVDISIPATRRVRRQVGVRLHRTSAAFVSLHPVASPPRSRVEVALLDHTDAATVDVVVDLVLRVIQRRVTTAARLRSALAARPRHRFRALLLDVLKEANDGVQSTLERRYRHDVEVRHALPRSQRHQPETTPTGARRYRDVRYGPWSTLVELDGREAHPTSEAFRDHRRDNAATVAGDASLRYGWRDVAARPCIVAAEVGRVLQSRGWPGGPESCGPECALVTRSS